MNILNASFDTCFTSFRFHITADKREIKDFPKFTYRRTSFIRETSGGIKKYTMEARR